MDKKNISLSRSRQNMVGITRSPVHPFTDKEINARSCHCHCAETEKKEKKKKSFKWPDHVHVPA